MVETPYAPALLLDLFLKCVILNCVLQDFVYAVLKKWMIFIDLDILSWPASLLSASWCVAKLFTY